MLMKDNQNDNMVLERLPLGRYITVSYTHLDVYKRQVETGGFGECADNRARFPDFGRAYQPS